MSFNQTMNIAVESLKNNQYALTVVSQNIANINTDGYIKKSVNFETNPSTHVANNVYGIIKGMNGASIASLGDIIDDATLRELYDTNSNANFYNELADELGSLEDVMDSLGDNGLNSLLNDFYTSLSNLEQYPLDTTIRQQFAYSAQNVTDKFNEISDKFDELENDTIDSIENNVDNINTLLNNIVEINKETLKSNNSADIQTQAASLLEELSNYTDFISQKNSNGTYDVYIGGTKVISSGGLLYSLESNKIKTSDGVKMGINLVSEDEKQVLSGIENNIKGGSLGAELEFLNDTNSNYSSIVDIRNELNNVANKFADTLNNIQTYSSSDSEGNEIFAANITLEDNEKILEKSTTPLFVASDGTSKINASNIQVNSDIMNNVNLIATARIDISLYEGEKWKQSVGNSTNATLMSDVQNQKLLDGETLSQYLVQMASKNGLDIKNINSKAQIYQDLYDETKNNYLNEVGVNVDEELSDMLKYQRAYEASAKIFSATNDIFTVLMNMV